MTIYMVSRTDVMKKKHCNGSVYRFWYSQKLVMYRIFSLSTCERKRRSEEWEKKTHIFNYEIKTLYKRIVFKREPYKFRWDAAAKRCANRSWEVKQRFCVCLVKAQLKLTLKLDEDDADEEKSVFLWNGISLVLSCTHTILSHLFRIRKPFEQ